MTKRDKPIPDALEELVAAHFNAAAGFCRFLTGSEDAGRELLAESVALATLRFRQLRDHSRFRAWLYAIIRNRWRTTYARRKRELSLDALNPSAASGANPSGSDYDRRVVDDTLARLRPHECEAFVLFYLEDMTLKEVASVLGVRVGAVKTRLHRARKRLEPHLRGLMNPFLDTPPVPEGVDHD